jgi:hypothetical protein
MQRASYSIGSKLPNTFSASVSTSAKTRAAYSVAMFPTAKKGLGSLHLRHKSHPKRHGLEANASNQWIHLTRYIHLDSIAAPDSSNCPNEGSIIGIVVESLYFRLNGIIQFAHPCMKGMHAFATFGALLALLSFGLPSLLA